MEPFTTIILAEIMLDIAFVGWSAAFVIRTKLHWYFLAFWVTLSPFYLYQQSLPNYFELPVVVVLIILELILFYRLIKIDGYKRSEKLKIYDIVPDANVDEMFRDIDKLITVAFPVVIPIVAGEFLVFPDVFKTPAILLTSLILLLLLVKYFVFNIFRKDKLNKLSNQVSTFLQLVLLYAITLFVVTLAYLYNNLGIGLLGASVFATSILILPTSIASDFVLTTVGSTVLKDKNQELSKEFIGLSTHFSHLEILLIVVLSDIPIIYSFMLSQNLNWLIYWTLGFSWGLLWMYRDIFAKIGNFKVKAGLLTQNEINAEITDLETIAFVTKFRDSYNASSKVRRLVKIPSTMFVFAMLIFVFKVQLDLLSAAVLGFVVALIIDIVLYKKPQQADTNNRKQAPT